MKGWYGNKMGHSLASRGIKSASSIFGQDFYFDDESLDSVIERAKDGEFEYLELVINRGRQIPYIRWYWDNGGSMNTRFHQTDNNEDAENVLENLLSYLNDNDLGHLVSYIDIDKYSNGVKRMSANKWVKSFDTSTKSGIEEAEKFKESLENKFDKVETKIIGIDEVLITGQNILLKDKKPVVHEKEHLGFHRDEVMHNAYMKAMDNISGRGGDSKREIAFEMRKVLRNNGYEEYVELV